MAQNTFSNEKKQINEIAVIRKDPFRVKPILLAIKNATKQKIINNITLESRLSEPDSHVTNEKALHIKT